jgi:hypothetical protein
LAIALSSSLTTISSTAAAAADRQPNVVLFLIDDLGWSDL